MKASLSLAACLIGTMCFAGVGNAQFTSEEIPLSEVIAKGGRKLSKDELSQMLPGAQIISVAGNQSVRRWKDDPDGTLFASSSSSRNGAPGTWRIGDNGTFCVQIEWRYVNTEKWCRFVFQAGSDYYAAASEKNVQGKAYKLGIEK